jgi:pimeloyl-ACP methyl ester carboxylesterase
VPGTRLLQLFAAVLTFACTGCVLHVQRDVEPSPGFQYDPPQGATQPFDSFERTPVELSQPFDETRNHEIVRLRFRSSGRNGHPDNLVEGQYFRSKQDGRKSLVVVMPIWGTSSYPPAKISTGYARRAGNDTHVIWIYGNAPVFPWDELSTVPSEDGFRALARDSVERYRSAVVDMRRLVDWATVQPEIDPSRIAFVGFSMSALVTATLLANEPRVSAGVLMMGAARFSDIFSMCRNRAGDVREHALRAFGWTPDAYHDFFEELFSPADPVRFEGRYDPDKILMIDAMFDDCMPESSRAALWEITGHPKRVTFLYQHRSAFYSLTPLGLNVSRRKIYRFLDESFGRRRAPGLAAAD